MASPVINQDFLKLTLYCIILSVMNRVEALSQTVGITDNKTVNKEVIPFTDIETIRIASIAAIINYLVENGEIDIKPNYEVLDLGTGSGVGVYAWRAYGVSDENITALDIEDKTKAALLGKATFVETDAQTYLKKIAGQRNFDIISAFRIPRSYHDYTGNRKVWLEKIHELLRDENSYYLETYSEWEERLPPPQNSENSPSLRCFYFSFMGDKLEVPNLPLLKQQGISNSVRMGCPDGVFEENAWLDGHSWVPCDPNTGEPKPKINSIHKSSGHGGYFGPDEYDVWALYGGGKKYPFGKQKTLEFRLGYTDNLAVLFHKKIPVAAETQVTEIVTKPSTNTSSKPTIKPQHWILRFFRLK